MPMITIADKIKRIYNKSYWASKWKSKLMSLRGWSVYEMSEQFLSLFSLTLDVALNKYLKGCLCVVVKVYIIVVSKKVDVEKVRKDIIEHNHSGLPCLEL